MAKKKTTAKKDDRIDVSRIFFGSDETDSDKIQKIGVLVEDTHSKMQLVIEGMQLTEERLTRKVDEFRQEFREDINMLKTIVTGHSEDLAGLKTDAAGLKTDVARLDNKMDRVEANLSAKIDKVMDRVDNHEVRITVLETEHP